MWTTLIVEDEQEAKEYVKTLLRKAGAGFRVVAEASDGEEALALIERLRPDLVISDIMMPVMDGVELLKRSREAGYECRFVMLTCMNEFEYARQALEYGASSYMLKLSMDLNSFKMTLEKIDGELRKLGRIKHLETYLQAMPEDTGEETDHPDINKIIRYAKTRFNETVTLSAMAEYVNMDPSYLSDLFKRKTGVTLTHYVKQLRVDAAKFYLAQTGDAVSEIGERVGFQNDNYFIKIFKRFTGVTPSHYRKQLKQEQPGS
ncbi:response regulator transcription factor [Paenibacillus alkalitolerans]|uniref:response regulator transcription factor n=1 Tax=Paenibacillus alkalitolerans TaxID=2799335 RepID=UPI0018F3ABC9|nr:helix-turn-helix domain-containing protein [Paenibacillus alkalitolerans]